VLAKGIAAMPGLKIDPAKVRSNIIIFDCEGTGKNAVELCDLFERRRSGRWILRYIQ